MGSIIDAPITYLTNLMADKCKKIKSKELLEVESNDRDGYYFTIAKSREKILRSELTKYKSSIKIDFMLEKLLKSTAKILISNHYQKDEQKFSSHHLLNILAIYQNKRITHQTNKKDIY